MKNISIFIVLLATCSLSADDAAKSATAPPHSPPEWAKYAVWYQIFPERFFNGDRNNDPGPAEMANAWPYFVPDDWQIHPWTSDWYQLQPWETNIAWHERFTYAEEGKPSFNLSAGLRRYGGDLQGILNKLDYLQNLGITAIYLNPIFESPSLHKYDTAIYRHVDNNFGPDPAGDRQIWETEDPLDPTSWQWTAADKLFLRLIEACHERGMKIIIDGVFNHTGNNFWAFRHLQEHQAKSPYQDWYTIKAWDDPSTPENEFRYVNWGGADDLPEVRQDENGLVEPVANYFHQIIRRWMDPNGDGDPSDGVDGWRLDVAEKVHINFWKKFRGWVKDINPDAYLTGELWWEDWQNNKMVNAAPWFDGAFDGVMNYRVARALKKYVIDQKRQISTMAFIDSIRTIQENYGRAHMLASQNLLDSHDVDRIASQVVNPDGFYDHNASAIYNPDYNVRRPNEQEWQRLKLIVALQILLPGAPMIYYGGEAGMWGGDDPCPRKPMVWPELQYDNEEAHPLFHQRSSDAVQFNDELFAYYQHWIKFRRANPVIVEGDLTMEAVEEMPSLLVIRYDDSKRLVKILANNSSRHVRYRERKNGDNINLPPYGIIALR